MTIRRSASPLRKNFTIIPNEAMNDKRLSWEARGMLAYFLSKPDHWKVIPKALINETDAGKVVVYRVLKELEDAGYITTEQKHRKDGTFSENERVVHEVSCIIPDGTASRLPVSGLAVSGLAVSGKSGHIVRTDLEKELIGERTDESSLPISDEKGDKSKNVNTEIPPYQAEFDELWAIYPRRTGRKKAYTQLVATLRRGISLDTLREAVQNYAHVRVGEEETFTLHAATFWGPSDRWEDYLDGGAGLKTDEAKKRPKGFSAISDFLSRGE